MKHGHKAKSFFKLEINKLIHLLWNNLAKQDCLCKVLSYTK